MSRREKSLSRLGLCLLAALGLMAFAASAAQAQGEFTVNLGKALLATLVGESEGSSAFLVPSLNLELICEEAALEGEITGSSHGSQKISFSSCEVAEVPECDVVEPIVANFLNEVVQHGEEAWIVFLAPEGTNETFTVIKFKSGTGCVLPLTNPLKGSFLALVGPSAVEQLIGFVNDHTTVSLFKELGIKISYAFGTQPALLEINMIWKLTGAHAGMKWGAL